MPNAFDERLAEFQGMDGLSCLAEDDECLMISGVAHKAFVTVGRVGNRGRGVHGGGGGYHQVGDPGGAH